VILKLIVADYASDSIILDSSQNKMSGKKDKMGHEEVICEI